jgi:dodecin
MDSGLTRYPRVPRNDVEGQMAARGISNAGVPARANPHRSLGRARFFRHRQPDATFTCSREHLLPAPTEQENDMADSVYKVIELVGTSSESWERAATNAVEQAAKTLRDLRVAEVVELDMQLDAKGKVEAYRAKLNVSFKFEGS